MIRLGVSWLLFLPECFRQRGFMIHILISNICIVQIRNANSWGWQGLGMEIKLGMVYKNRDKSRYKV